MTWAWHGGTLYCHTGLVGLPLCIAMACSSPSARFVILRTCRLLACEDTHTHASPTCVHTSSHVLLVCSAAVRLAFLVPLVIVVQAFLRGRGRCHVVSEEAAR